MNKIIAVLCWFGWAFLVIAPEALARAGGGRSGGGGGGIISLILLPFFLAYAWWKKRKINEKNLQAKELLERIAKLDPIWDESHVVGAASKNFLAVQEAWCLQDLPALRELLAPALYGVWEKDVTALQQKGWTNKMEGLRLKAMRVVEVKNFKDDTKDSFTVCVEAAAADYTVDRSGAIVESNSSDEDKQRAKQKSFEGFIEFWTFARDGAAWRLERVDDDGDWQKTVSAPLVNEDAPPN